MLLARLVPPQRGTPPVSRSFFLESVCNDATRSDRWRRTRDAADGVRVSLELSSNAPPVHAYFVSPARLSVCSPRVQGIPLNSIGTWSSRAYASLLFLAVSPPSRATRRGGRGDSERVSRLGLVPAEHRANFRQPASGKTCQRATFAGSERGFFFGRS